MWWLTRSVVMNTSVHWFRSCTLPRRDCTVRPTGLASCSGLEVGEVPLSPRLLHERRVRSHAGLARRAAAPPAGPVFTSEQTSPAGPSWTGRARAEWATGGEQTTVWLDCDG